MKIIQLIPHLSPPASGITDYAMKIAHKLLEESEIFTHFLTYDFWYPQHIKQPPDIAPFSLTRLTHDNSEHFLSLIPEEFDAILLHYSFSEQNASPFWLIKNLQLAARKHHFKLIVIFHELRRYFVRKGIKVPAPNHIWSGLKTGMAADTIITNNFLDYAYLSRWFGNKVLRLPNFSTIGEPSSVPSLSDRNRTMIVFGTKARRSVYLNFLRELIESCQILNIEKIYDIGPSCGASNFNFAGIPLVEMDRQSEEIISELMLNALAGFIDYSQFLGRLGKSTIFATYCSHGLLPISSVDNRSQGDGLRVNEQYIIPSRQLNTLDFQQLEEIAYNAYHWYHQHNLYQFVRTIALCMQGEDTSL